MGRRGRISGTGGPVAGLFSLQKVLFKEAAPLRRLAFTLLLCLSTENPAHAGGDCVAEYSSADPALVLCPAGDLEFHADARIAPGVLAFRVFQILLDITDATGLRLAGAQPDPACQLATYGGRDYALQSCSPMGHAVFRLSGGGCGTGVVLPVGNSHDAVVLATPTTFLSPDQDGNLFVDGADLALVEAKLGTHDPTADFDFDGTVTEGDQSIAQAHFGHLASGSGPVAARRGTWGRLKSLIY